MHPYLNIATSAARSAGKLIVRATEQMDRVQVTEKQTPNDFVTSIDQASEREIIYHIQKAYPEHSILAEESGLIQGKDEGTLWIIDPLDGTLNFLHGHPHVAISIAVQHKGVVQHGLVYNPFSGELFTATKGSGAQLDGHRIRVSQCQALQSALLGTGFAYKRTQETVNQCLARLKPLLENSADIRRAGAAALDLAYVAAGRLDGFWESGLAIWDIAAGALLIREAGGFVSDFSGDSRYLETGEIVAGAQKIYPALLDVMKASA